MDGLFFVLISIGLFLFVRETPIKRYAYVVFLMVLGWLLLKIGNLTYSAKLVEMAILFMLFVIVIVFQVEIRTGVKRYIRERQMETSKKRSEGTLDVIGKAAFEMSKKRVGALILFDPKERIIQACDNYVTVGAKVTKELITTIFHPNTSLHDGAVIIHNGKVSHAGCKLPFSGRKREETQYQHLGTRHLVALEMAESHDIIALVVSEQTGIIRLANKNGLHTIEQQNDLVRIFQERETPKEKETR